MFPTKSVAACHVRRTFASLTSLGVGVWLLVCPASARAQVLVTGRDITATEGIARINVLVATFTDLPTDNITNYTAAIDWGDSTMSTGVISAAAGHFNVRGTHTYVDEGFFIPTITVNDSDGSTNFDVGTATVDDAPLSGIGRTITPVEGVSFTAIIADFADANPFATTNDFTASIDWGDGAVTAGRVAPDGTDFSVTGTHTYAAEGMYDITVSVDDVGGSGVVISSVANASDVPLSVTGVVLTPVEGVPFTNVVATFTDPDPTIDSPASFSATINWSDGTVSAGIVSTNGTGGFTVTEIGRAHV